MGRTDNTKLIKSKGGGHTKKQSIVYKLYNLFNDACSHDQLKLVFPEGIIWMECAAMGKSWETERHISIKEALDIGIPDHIINAAINCVSKTAFNLPKSLNTNVEKWLKNNLYEDQYWKPSKLDIEQNFSSYEMDVKLVCPGCKTESSFDKAILERGTYCVARLCLNCKNIIPLTQKNIKFYRRSNEK